MTVSNFPGPHSSDPDSGLSIGDLADLTGVSAATLRVWESRHGFPAPHRRASGHRRYDEDDVATVRDVVRRREGGVRLDVAIAQATAATDAAAAPAPIPLTSRTPPSPIHSRARATTTTTPAVSIYADLRRTHPGLAPQRLTKATLLALSWAIEDEFLSRPQQAHVFGAFQQGRFFRAASARWADLARTTSSTHVFADFGDDDGLVAETSGRGVPHMVALADDSPLRREWAVVCDGPSMPVALAAWELPGQHDVRDRDRIFESVWTVDAMAVRQAARSCADLAVMAGTPGAAGVRDALGADVSPRTLDVAAVTSLFGRVVDYVDRRVERRA